VRAESVSIVAHRSICSDVHFCLWISFAGCELLKDMVMSGFRSMEVVDLDTIDVSNLNRQFLFRPSHVGRPKSTVAAEMALRFNRAAGPILPLHANIVRDARFSAAFFAQFDVVVNALDNVAARSHVNRMCVANRLPLVEGGSTGLKGQAQAIVPTRTQCYNCMPKPVQKTYPVCTIRR
jgi:ubiquitin-like 1-activating enzyme E1 B